MKTKLHLHILLIALLLPFFSTPLFAALKKGDTFPDLAKFGLEGKIPDLKGKVVIIDFWASWCGPCKESFPAMNELQKQYAAKDLVILAVNVDENKSDMENFLKENPAAFTVLRDAKQKLVDLVEIGTMPSSFILAKDGTIQYTHSGFHGAATKSEYEKQIETLLK